MPSRIEDYALSGDCYTAALISRDGSIDWLCVPRFDSGACFAAVLDTPEHGRWLLAPKDEVLARRRHYRENTLILETEYETAEGAVTVVDCMLMRAKGRTVIRVVEGRRGRVRMGMELVIRFDYGSIVPWVQRIEGGLSDIAGPDRLLLRSEAPIRNENFTTTADFLVSAGERVAFTLIWHRSHKKAPSPVDTRRAILETEEWWHKWSAH